MYKDNASYRPSQRLPIQQRREQLIAAATSPFTTSDQRVKAVDVLCRLLVMRRRRREMKRQGRRNS